MVDELITAFFLGLLRGSLVVVDVVLLGGGVISDSHCESSETVLPRQCCLSSIVVSIGWLFFSAFVIG